MQDIEIVSIREAGTGDKGWAIHTDGSLQYRGWIVSPFGKAERGDPSGIPLFSFCGASRWHEDVS